MVLKIMPENRNKKIEELDICEPGFTEGVLSNKYCPGRDLRYHCPS